MDNNIHLGSKIRKYRHLAGMTQEELAEYSNLSVNYISKIEREKKQNVSIEKLVDICNALDISFEEILEKKILNLTCIYMDGSVPDLEDNISGLKDFLKENKIYGSYYIKILNAAIKDQSGKEIGSLISKDKDIVLSEMHYNQFD